MQHAKKSPANGIIITIEIEPGTGVRSLRECDSAEFCLDAYSLICEMLPEYDGDKSARVSVALERY